MLHDEPRPVRGLRRKAVLAVLALRAGEIVSTDHLADAVWGGDPPPTAVNTLQSHVSYLRSLLGKPAIVGRPPGYLLDLGDDGTDVQAAGRLLRQGTQPGGDPAAAVRHLTQALALWRGHPLADVTGLAWLEAQAEILDVLRVRVKQALSEARLAAGEHAQLIPELEQMVAEHPMDERLHGQLMLALYRSGRQADALGVYRRLRATLGEELGIDPGQVLRDLQTAILQQDPSLNVAAPVVAVAAPAIPVPAQLPSAVPAFTGRTAELAGLDALVPAGEPDSPSAAAAVVALSGTAGVGKTTLAVYWAHRVAGQFPDGQLYVNLRGFEPAGPALDPGQALRGFLDAFGVPAERVPADLAAQAGLYRSVVAGKRVLVVLDNARSAEQVRPLLPGSPGCLVVVTSRDQLVGLVATEGAYPVALDLLTTTDARRLLIRRLGAARVSDEPAAVEAIVAACARLPLALSIAAARAAISPGFPLAAIAAELRDATSALDPFDGGDTASDVRAVFSWSYRALSDPAARLFRLLGLHPGPDIAAAAAASLAAVTPEQARVLLGELTGSHLLTEQAPGRYTFHDLLRAYARELAHLHDSSADRAAATHRVLDHYLHTAHNAAVLMEPFFNPVTLGPPPPEVMTGPPVTADEAVSWFATEQATLLAAIQLAGEAGLSTHAWQLAWALSTFLLRRGLWHEQVAACQAALAAARRAGDTVGEANALHRLAVGYAKSGRVAASAPLFRDALLLFEISGDHASQAIIHRHLSWIANRDQRPEDMLSHSLQCLELFRLAGHRPGEAIALQDVGHSHALLGNYDEAIAHCERALAVMREIGEARWEGAVWDSLGYTHHQRGDYQQAITCFERAIELSRELGDRFNEADTLSSLGDVYDSAGDAVAAHRSWAQALQIFDEIEHPDRDRVRAKLNARDNRTGQAGRLAVSLGSLPGRRGRRRAPLPAAERCQRQVAGARQHLLLQRPGNSGCVHAPLRLVGGVLFLGERPGGQPAGEAAAADRRRELAGLRVAGLHG
jgi:DNA-binding SARP family transcriptional activator/tetratricopeptide (TPR) repeat protein